MLLLSLSGEDVARPARHVVLLQAASRILVDHVDDLIAAGADLAPWWAARVLFTHQAILSGPVPQIRFKLFTHMARISGKHVVESRGESMEDILKKGNKIYDGKSPVVVTESEMKGFKDQLDENNLVERELKVLLLLEISVAQRYYFDIEGGEKSFDKANDVEGVIFAFQGQKGVRTRHQKKAVAQLKVTPYWKHQLDRQKEIEDFAFRANFPNSSKPGEEVILEEQNHVASNMPPLPKNIPVNDTDVLGYVKFTGENDPIETVSNNEASDSDVDESKGVAVVGKEIEHLTPLQQALALTNGEIVKAKNAWQELTWEQMSPYVNLVIQNSKSPYGTSSMLQVQAMLLRVTFEQNKGRYLERCMTQMEEISRFVDDSMDTSSQETRLASACERNVMLFASAVPPKWELKKHLAVAFGKMGLVKSAMEIFRKLEYWDELVDCHRLIGNLGAAEAMVREQLDNLDKAVLDEGVDGSIEGSTNILKYGSQGAAQARAARRPRLLCVLGDVTRNKEHFMTAWEESDCKYGRAKRALGRLCVEEGDWEGAVEHFKDALAANPLYPDTWFTYGYAALQINNLKLASNAFTMAVQQSPRNAEAWNNLARILYELGKKKEAIYALNNATRIKRNSWRIWDNIRLIATEIKSSLDIVNSMERLLELRGKDGVASGSIRVAVAEVIRMSRSNDPQEKVLVEPVGGKLLRILGRCTAMVSTNPSIWGAYSELHENFHFAGGTQNAFDCRLKQVRSLKARDHWKSTRSEFFHMVEATDALIRNALQSEDKTNIRAAKLHLQSVIEQTNDDFHDDDGFEQLKDFSSRFDPPRM